MHDDDENIRLTDDQQYVFDKFKAFIKNNQQKVFILNGHAGTGKTTLIRFFIDELRDRKLNYNLMASTGRAAKILTNITGTPASTVHSIIYSLEGFNQDIEEIAREEDETGVDETGQLVLIFGLTPKSPSKEQYFYIVDEASMIADVEDKNPTQARVTAV
jgi:Cdc6-like AAA superfamily ATPase